MTNAEIYASKLRELTNELDKVRKEILAKNIDEEAEFTDNSLSGIVGKLHDIATIVELSDFRE